MHAFGILLRKELHEAWRTRRTPVILGLFVIIGMAAPLLARFTPEIVAAAGSAALAAAIPAPSASDAVDQFLKLTGQLGAFAAILLAMGAVAGERDRGTAALVLTKPVGRGAFLAAKLVALSLVLLVAAALAGVMTAVYTAVLFEPLPVAGIAGAIGLTWLGLLIPAVITFLGSVVGRSAMVAAGIGFAWVIGSGVLAALPGIGPDMPAALTAQARALALGVPAGSGSLAAPLAVSGLVLLAAVMTAWGAFRHQEL